MTIDTLIIGAGPAGLAVAGRLRKLGLPFEILEASDKIAQSWHNHYDRLCLHTVKQLSHLPHLPFPHHYPTYVTRQQLVEYLESYARHFEINPKFNQSVISIEKMEGNWEILTQSGEQYLSKNVVVATGVNRVPVFPDWQGLDQFEGKIIHSREYKNAQPFIGQRTLVIGMGNTGAEIALDLSEHNVPVWLSVRSPVVIVPRDFLGNPVQLTARKLEKLPWGLGDWIGTLVRKITYGDLSKYGIPISNMPPAKQLRETGKTPVIDLGTVEHIKKNKIKTVGDIQSFHKKSITFTHDTILDIDSVIVCTGYQPQIGDFIIDTSNLLDKYGAPKQPIADAAHSGLFFVGFDNYKLGGILGTIYKDSETVVSQIKEHKLS